MAEIAENLDIDLWSQEIMAWYLATVLGIFDPHCKSLAKERNNNFFFYFEMEILVLNEMFFSML